jgi:hypothetical protein
MNACPPAEVEWDSTSQRDLSQTTDFILKKSAFAGTNPTDDSITSLLPLIRYPALAGNPKGRAHRALRDRLEDTFHEREQVGVNRVGLGGGHAVRKALVNFQGAIP